MAFSEIELKRIDNLVGGLCRRQSPAHLKVEVSLEYRVKGHDVVIFARRPAWRGEGFTESPVAKLKFVRSAGEWRLFWQRADLRWHRYDMLRSSCKLAELVLEVDEDPFACFFG